MKRRKMTEKDLYEYINKLDPESKKWAKQFYKEYYYAPCRNEAEIITDEEGIKEANRVHNALYRDAMNIAEKTGRLTDIADNEKAFMEDAADEWDWQNTYKQQGYESAIKEIFYQTERDLDNKVIDRVTTLARFLNKYLALKKLNNRRRDSDK